MSGPACPSKSPVHQLTNSNVVCPAWHTSHVTDVIDGGNRDAVRDLTESERELAIQSETRWQRAHHIASLHPGVDPSDVYHALRCLELDPAERLRRGLSRGRLRTYAR